MRPAGIAQLIEVEVIGAQCGHQAGVSLSLATAGALRVTAEAALAAVGVYEGHVAVALVSEEEIQRLNREYRGRDRPTDVLSFPVDEAGTAAGPRELGDVVVCPEHTESLAEAVVHGVLHLCGYDHETDSGEMLALQDRVMGCLEVGRQ